MSCLCLLLLSSLLSAATPALLVGPDLKPKAVNLQALGGGRMTYFDDQRNMQVDSTNDVLQIRFPVQAPADDALSIAPATPGSAAPPPRAFVQLIDGQRVIARFASTRNDGQSLVFEHETLGELTVALDQVARLGFDAEPANAATPAEDQVTMTNGDVVTGFVVSLGDKDIEIQKGDAKPFKLPRDRVKSLHLANPLKSDAGRRSVVWLRDGSRIAAQDVSISADKVALAAPLAAKAAVSAPLAAVARIELASPAGRLIDLTDLPLTVTEGGKVFGLPMTPQIDGDALRLHAPVTVSFDLPPKAVRFAALARLDAQGSGARMADFIIELSCGDAPLARHPLSADAPAAAINVALKTGPLIIRLDPAANGPVMDRLRLSDAVIFVER